MARRSSINSTSILETIIVLAIIILMGVGAYFLLVKTNIIQPINAHDTFTCAEGDASSIELVSFGPSINTAERDEDVDLNIGLSNLDYATISKVVINSVEYTSFNVNDDGNVLKVSVETGEVITQKSYTLNSISYSICETSKVLSPTSNNVATISVTGNIPEFETITLTNQTYYQGNEVLAIITFSDVTNLEVVTIDGIDYNNGSNFIAVPGNKSVQIAISKPIVDDYTIVLESFEFDNGASNVLTEVTEYNTADVRIVYPRPIIQVLAAQVPTVITGNDVLLEITFSDPKNIYKLVINDITYNVGLDFTIDYESNTIIIPISNLDIGLHTLTLSDFYYIDGFVQQHVVLSADNSTNVTVVE